MIRCEFDGKSSDEGRLLAALIVIVRWGYQHPFQRDMFHSFQKLFLNVQTTRLIPSWLSLLTITIWLLKCSILGSRPFHHDMLDLINPLSAPASFLNIVANCSSNLRLQLKLLHCPNWPLAFQSRSWISWLTNETIIWIWFSGKRDESRNHMTDRLRILRFTWRHIEFELPGLLKMLNM